MKFTIKGHKNLLSTHQNTIEFTKDSHLTTKGDCIVGINANFKNIKSLLKSKRAKATIKAGKLSDSFSFEINPRFDHKSEIVIRKSDFRDKRTLGIKSNKAAINLNKKLINYLKNNKKATVEINPIKIKNIILDFDDTLVDLKYANSVVEKRLTSFCKKKYDVDDFGKSFLEADLEMTIKARTEKNPSIDNRALWAKIAGKKLGLNLSKSQCEEIRKLYWDIIFKEARILPHTKETLKKLKKKHSLFMLSDADGENPNEKLKRVKDAGLAKFFTDYSLGDKLGTTKPDYKFYTYWT